MILSVINSQLSSNPTTGGILNDGTNGLITSFPNNVFDLQGLLVIKGNGYVLGSSNPSNTTPDVLSLVAHKPFISDSTDTLFSKIFTAAFTSFFFEIHLGVPSGSSAYTPFIMFSFEDGTVVTKVLSINISINTFFGIALKHTSVSTLYSITIANVVGEYKSLR